MNRRVRPGGREGCAHPERESVVLSLASEVLRTSGSLRFAALGASMVPAIYPGDILIVRRETARNARCGDVVLSSHEGGFRAHRLVDKIEEGGRLMLVTRGDTHANNDPPLAEGEFLGCVTAVVRRGKRIELGSRATAWQLPLRWTARHSSSALKALLRWHSLRMRLARNSGRVLTEVQPEPMECA